MTEEQKLGYAMKVAYEMSQAFLQIIGDDPAPSLEETTPERRQAIANIVQECRTSKSFRHLLSRITDGNFANNHETMQTLLLVVSARMAWLDVTLMTQTQGRA